MENKIFLLIFVIAIPHLVKAGNKGVVNITTSKGQDLGQPCDATRKCKVTYIQFGPKTSNKKETPCIDGKCCRVYGEGCSNNNQCCYYGNKKAGLKCEQGQCKGCLTPRHLCGDEKCLCCGSGVYVGYFHTCD